MSNDPMNSEATQDTIKQYEKQRNRRVTQALIALVAVGVALTINILYVSYNQRQADKRWCELFTGLDDSYRVRDLSRAPTETKKFAGSVHDLRLELHCPSTVVSVPTPTPSDSASTGG